MLEPPTLGRHNAAPNIAILPSWVRLGMEVMLSKYSVPLVVVADLAGHRLTN